MENRALFKITDKDAEGAIPLYEGVGSNETPCCYAVKKSFFGDKSIVKNYVLKHETENGGGGMYGSADRDIKTKQSTEPIELERIVFDEDGSTVLGYAYTGKWSSSGNSGSNSRTAEVFLPVEGEARETDYSYTFVFYPFDGTEFEGRSSTKSTFERK